MRGRPPTIREEVILDAARDVFRAEGHAATTAKIAERAGVSEGILFYRYKTKEGLLAAVVHRETQPPEEIRHLIERAGTHTLEDNLRFIVERVLDSVYRAHPFLELLLGGPSSGELRRALLVHDKPPPQRIVEAIVEYLEAERRLGRVRDIDAEAAARALLGACVNYVRWRRPSADPADRQRYVGGLVDFLSRGATNRPSFPA